MKAILYEVVAEDTVKCSVCSHYCLIKNGKRGLCGVRENVDGELIALNYGLSIATSIDPIEKKPIFEYLPGTTTYSFSTVGCNMDCPWCQNQSISQVPKPNNPVEGYNISPELHVSQAVNYNCPSISYTYTEPTIFLEYAYDTMKIAKRNGLKNIWVTNGYMSSETLDIILPYLDAANVDYKGTKDTYKKYLKCDNLVVLNNLKRLKESNIHLEVTTLFIPGINDKISDIKAIIKDLTTYLGTDFVWHVSRFFPHYKLKNKAITKLSTLNKAKQLGEKAGIKRIYLGNT
ncbi:MAG: AmmeMemoRadiSam system radical SAM enzyme [Tenericutes bacterium]|nr:AmmeMemoRadiSam system radical SAM enzyme [Mycoplasmatota bacterium]